MSLLDFHTHSYFSKDSIMAPEKIIEKAKKKGLKGIAITDHNTIKGGFQAKKQNIDHDFIVIVGSEIKTETCEIIGLFLNEDVSSPDPLIVIDKIRDQGGITVLPHPFRSLIIPRRNKQKKIPIEIIDKINIIEAVNARTRDEDNQKALDLAFKLKKPIIGGSDAHLYREIARIKALIAPFDTEEDLRKILLKEGAQVELRSHLFYGVIPFMVLCGLYSRMRSFQENKI